MSPFREITEVSSADYERAVKQLLDSHSDRPGRYESKLLEPVRGSDGEYVIDVTARFTALGGDFLVLVECKRHKRRWSALMFRCCIRRYSQLVHRKA